MPSQPPDPYFRQFSFTGWSLTHPGEPHQGDKIDLELNEVKQSLDQTQARLALIQTDDGHVRASALSHGIHELAQQVADDAAERTYADNLASVADKALARLNLQLPQHHPELNGDNLVFSTSATNPPIPPISNTPLPGQSANGTFGGVFPSSPFAARQFRASVLFGTLYDHPTMTTSGVPAAPAVSRVDNVALALLYGGTLGKDLSTGGTPSYIPASTFNGDYQKLNLLPGINNPFATVRQLVDVADTRQSAHLAAFNHSNLPTDTQKAALNAASTASGTNRFATLNDVQAAGNFTPDQMNAVYNAASPSGSNVFVTGSALTGVLTAGYSQLGHVHDASEISLLATNLDIWASDIDGRVSTVEAALPDKADAAAVSALLDLKADETNTGIAKAWVTFDGSTTPPTIRSSRNVTGVARNSTGVYTITFASSVFPDANYCWIGSGRNPGSNHGLIISQDDASKTQTATTLQVTSQGDDGSAQNATLVNVVVYR